MTKSEIEKLIVYIDTKVVKHTVVNTGSTNPVVCSVNDLYDLLRNYPIESDKTAGPDYKALYVECETKRAELEAKLESVRFDMHHMAIDKAHYVGAVAAMETIFGRKFEPVK